LVVTREHVRVQAECDRHVSVPEPLKQRLEALQPRARAIGATQDELLETISARELEGQKRTIERYLTEARFAVARIYDRQMQGAQ